MNFLDAVDAQFLSLSRKYKELILDKSENGKPVIKGNLCFSASYNGVSITDNYEIELCISADFPDEPPDAKETGNRIPPSFHHYSDNTLCLGTPLEIHVKWKENSTLVGFIEEQVIPYLYSHSYFEKHGEMPFGELEHGGKGIIDYYYKLLNVESELAVIGFLKILADNNYRGHHPCPCGSGAKLRNCHGEQLLKIKTYQEANTFAFEYAIVGKHLVDNKIRIPRASLSKALLKKFKKSK